METLLHRFLIAFHEPRKRGGIIYLKLVVSIILAILFTSCSTQSGKGNSGSAANPKHIGRPEKKAEKDAMATANADAKAQAKAIADEKTRLKIVTAKSASASVPFEKFPSPPVGRAIASDESNPLRNFQLINLGDLPAGNVNQIFASPWSGNPTREMVYQHIRHNLQKVDFPYGVFLVRPQVQLVYENVGFLFLTAPERIEEDGKPARERWNLSRSIPNVFSLSEWFKNFFSTAPEGHYRLFAFAVTTQRSEPSRLRADWVLLNGMLEVKDDFSSLPPELRSINWNDARLHVYVYVFRRNKLEFLPHPLLEQKFSVVQHLNFSGLGKILNQIER